MLRYFFCAASRAAAINEALVSAVPSFSLRSRVFGAGLACLTCAYRLQQAGLVADVFEGSSRIGGRCWTGRGDFAEGQIYEHGGELIDNSHIDMKQLVQELGFTLDKIVLNERERTMKDKAQMQQGARRGGLAVLGLSVAAVWTRGDRIADGSRRIRSLAGGN